MKIGRKMSGFRIGSEDDEVPYASTTRGACKSGDGAEKQFDLRIGGAGRYVTV